MAKRLYIVSPYRPHLMDELVLNLGLSEDTQVFVDRRHGERSRGDAPLVQFEFDSRTSDRISSANAIRNAIFHGL